MSTKKSILLLLLVLLFGVPLWWYTLALPFGKAKDLSADIPIYFQSLVSQTFPEDLEITVENGMVSLNRDTPYCLLLDKETETGILFDPDFNPDAFLRGSEFDYPLCKPLFIVGESTITHTDKTPAGYSVQRISPTTNITIDRQMLENNTNTIVPHLVDWSWALYLIMPIFLIPLIFVGYLVVNLWHASINKILFTLLDTNYSSFSQSYAISLRFLTCLIILTGLILLYNQQFGTTVSISTIPFFNSIVIAICSFAWTKYANRTNYTSQPIQANQIPTNPNLNLESHAIPTPNEPQKTNISQENSTQYTFDPSIISTPEPSPTEKKSP